MSDCRIVARACDIGFKTCDRPDPSSTAYITKYYTFVDRSAFVQQNILLSDKSRFGLDKSTYDQQKLVLLTKVTFVKTGVTLVEKSKFC